MPSCSVAACRSRTNKMHQFPKDLHLREQWRAFCGREYGWYPRPSSRMCTVHFSPSDLTSSGRVKDEAVPQLILQSTIPQSTILQSTKPQPTIPEPTITEPTITQLTSSQSVTTLKRPGCDIQKTHKRFCQACIF